MNTWKTALLEDLGYLIKEENEDETDSSIDNTNFKEKMNDSNNIFGKSFNQFISDFFEGAEIAIQEWKTMVLRDVLNSTEQLSGKKLFEKRLRLALGNPKTLEFRYKHSNDTIHPSEDGNGPLYQIIFVNKVPATFTKTGRGAGMSFVGKIGNIHQEVKIDHSNFLFFLKAIFATFANKKDLLSNRTKKLKKDDETNVSIDSQSIIPTKDQANDTRNNNISKTHDAYMAKHFSDRGQGTQRSYSKHSTDD